MSNYRAAVLAAAKKEIAEGNHKRGEKYWRYMKQPRHCKWCACFVSFCLNEAGVPSNVAAQSTMVDGVQRSMGTRYHPASSDYQPKAGDLMFFNPSHIGIIESVDGSKIHTIEGNVSDMTQRCTRARHGKIGNSVNSTRGFGELDGEAPDNGTPGEENAVDPAPELPVYTAPGQGEITTEMPSGNYMIYWSGLTWSISPDKFNPAAKFTTSYSLRVQEKGATAGTSTLVPVGLEPQKISFSYTPLDDVLYEVNMLREYVGAEDFFYLGSGRVGEHTFRLTDVRLSEATPLHMGILAPAEIQLTFQEAAPDAINAAEGGVWGGVNQAILDGYAASMEAKTGMGIETIGVGALVKMTNLDSLPAYKNNPKSETALACEKHLFEVIGVRTESTGILGQNKEQVYTVRDRVKRENGTDLVITDVKSKNISLEKNAPIENSNKKTAADQWTIYDMNPAPEENNVP